MVAQVRIAGVAVEEDDLRADAETATSQFHIIQLGAVMYVIVSSLFRSEWRTSSFSWLISMPPTLWTMHLGLPVVPDENMI